MLEKTTRKFVSIIMKLKIKGYSTAGIPFSLHLSFEYNNSFSVLEIVKITTFVRKFVPDCGTIFNFDVV